MTMRPKTVSVTPITPDPDGICAAQQLAGAGNLTINGALASGGAVSLANAYQVCLVSAGNISTTTFTITGTDANGAAQVVAIAGPNATTVETAEYFKTVTQIAASGAFVSDVTVGTVDELASQTIPVDIYTNVTSLAVDISGTIDFTVQKCYERPTNGETPNWINITALAAKTADTATAETAPIGGVRFIVNSYTAGATISLRIIQGRNLA